MVEQGFHKTKVGGSIPPIGTKLNAPNGAFCLVLGSNRTKPRPGRIRKPNLPAGRQGCPTGGRGFADGSAKLWAIQPKLKRNPNSHRHKRKSRSGFTEIGFCAVLIVEFFQLPPIFDRLPYLSASDVRNRCGENGRLHLLRHLPWRANSLRPSPATTAHPP